MDNNDEKKENESENIKQNKEKELIDEIEKLENDGMLFEAVKKINELIDNNILSKERVNNDIFLNHILTKYTDVQEMLNIMESQNDWKLMHTTKQGWTTEVHSFEDSHIHGFRVKGKSSVPFFNLLAIFYEIGKANT